MIDLNNESGVEVDDIALVKLARFALSALRVHPQADLSIVLIDPDTMTALHVKHMGLPGPTDVMSFPMDELHEPGSDEEYTTGDLGEIYLCPQVIAEQAPDNGRRPDEEAQYLLIHGLLHLLGHDHVEPEERAVMFALNDRIIADWEAARVRG